MAKNDDKLTWQKMAQDGGYSFKEEAAERLAELEQILLALEQDRGNKELVAEAFRALHTIKGSGGMFGFDDIVAFIHDIETAFDEIRSGRIPVTDELITQTLAAHDQIGKMLDPGELSEIDFRRQSEITDFFKELRDPQSDEERHDELDFVVIEDQQAIQETFRIRFRPPADIFASGVDLTMLLNELRGLGESYIVAQTNTLPDLEEIDPDLCYTGWDIILTTNRGVNAIRDVFIFVEENCEINIESVDYKEEMDEDSPAMRLGEILVERGDIEKEDLREFLEVNERIGHKIEKAGLASSDQIQAALLEQRHVKNLREKRLVGDAISSIRVASTKLDRLVNLVGELVTGQARLSQIALDRNDPALLAVAEDIERLTAELRDSTMSVRMLDFGATFSKFKRLVRDLSRELGTEAELTTEGGETELDKTVIDRLNDPLVHILRNSVDHGIEPPEVRREAGKPRKGNITLSAKHLGAHVVIKVRDDGAGLDPELIKKRAVERGLVAADAKLTDKEIFALIFEPGFSTAESVTNVSGRGVGMDIVKKTIESMRGTVEIESKKGLEATIIIKLPLTLAIIDGLLVELGEERFIIPLSVVEECVELTRKDIENSHGRHLTKVRGQLVPYIRLRDQFAINGEVPDVEQVVITQIKDQRVGFVVDQVIGQHQTVIKNLSKIYRDVEAVSGATIMPDGNVALILDIDNHLRLVEKDL